MIYLRGAIPLLGIVTVCLCAPAGARAAGIPWHDSFAEALDAAKRNGKLVLVDFYAEWCEPCKMLEQETFPAASVVKAAEAYECVRVDIDKHTDLALRYAVEGIPDIRMLAPDGETLHGLMGFYPAEPFADVLTTALTLRHQLAVLKERPDDPRANYDVAMTYLALERRDDALALFEKVIKAARPGGVRDAAERRELRELQASARIARDACLAASGKKGRPALKRLESLVKRNPRDEHAALAKLHIALGYFAMDEYQRAIECAEALVRQHGDSPWAARAKPLIEQAKELAPQ